jgi:hypothetical protein
VLLPPPPPSQNHYPTWPLCFSTTRENSPEAYVADVLSNGVKMPDHGPAEMPVWGIIFKSTAKSDETQVKVRITKLTNYLKSIQTKRGTTARLPRPGDRDGSRVRGHRKSRSASGPFQCRA